MITKKIADERPKPGQKVTVKTAGNVIEVRYAVNGPPEIAIEKISADLYMDKRTGEVKEFQHKAASRAENKKIVGQSLKALRDLINANLADPQTALWVTLTYKENMRDAKQLYEDYRRFWQRFKYYLKKQGYPTAEYIIAAEPQARGAWHLHCLFLFPGKAPFIPNTDVARVWGQGYTKTKGLTETDNPGLYLTAYLGDMELTEAIEAGTFKAGRLREKGKKAVIKGGRLGLYPSGFNLYRCSRGIKRPEVEEMTEREAQEKIGGAPLIYEKTIAVVDERGETRNIINYRQYNRARGQGTAGEKSEKKQEQAETTGPR